MTLDKTALDRWIEREPEEDPEDEGEEVWLKGRIWFQKDGKIGRVEHQVLNGDGPLQYMPDAKLREVVRLLSRFTEVDIP